MPSQDSSDADTDPDDESYQSDLESIFGEATDEDSTVSSGGQDRSSTSDTGTSQDSQQSAASAEPDTGNPASESATSDPTHSDDGTPTADNPTAESRSGDSTSQRRVDSSSILTAFTTAGMAAGQFAAKKFWGRSNPHRGLSGLYYPNGAIGDDDVIFATTPSRWRSAGPYTITFILVTLAVALPLFITHGPLIPYLNSRSPSFITLTAPPLGLLLKLSAALLVIGGLMFFIEALRRASTWLILTDSKLIYRTRILDTELSEIRLQDINKTETMEPFPQKLVNLGNITLYTASTDNYELKFRMLKHPQRRGDQIERTRIELTENEDAP